MSSHSKPQTQNSETDSHTTGTEIRVQDMSEEVRLIEYVFLNTNMDGLTDHQMDIDGHFVQRGNKIWYLRRLMVVLPGYIANSEQKQCRK